MTDVRTGPVDDGRCFACGPHNPDGLHLDFVAEGEAGSRTEVTLAPRLQGYRDVAHGGIVMMLLDEAMAHACRFIGLRAVTASTEVRFRKPVPIGEPLVLHGRYRERRRNVLFLDAELTAHDGTLLATGTGTFMSLGPL